MKTYSVTVPITGKAVIEVEAESEEAAIEKAVEETTLNHLEEWTAVPRINQGNFCYAMRPWEAEAEVVSDGEDT